MSVIILCSNSAPFVLVLFVFPRPLSSVEHHRHLSCPSSFTLVVLWWSYRSDTGTRMRPGLLDEGRGECMCYIVLHLFHASSTDQSHMPISKFLSPGLTSDSGLKSRSFVQVHNNEGNNSLSSHLNQRHNALFCRSTALPLLHTFSSPTNRIPDPCDYWSVHAVDRALFSIRHLSIIFRRNLTLQKTFDPTHIFYRLRR